MHGLNQIAVGAYVTGIASFSWAMRRFFVRRHSALSRDQLLVVWLGFVFALWQVIAVARAPLLLGPALGWAFALWVLSLLTFWSAVRINWRQPLTWAFETDRPHHLVLQGPYHWVRHPFYLSYILFWLAAPVATGDRLLLVPAVTMGFLYWRSAVQEEMKFLNSSLADSYRRYQTHAGMFWPIRIR